jgi:DNA polymerase (family 10)
MDNAAIAAILREVGSLLQLKGDNPWKIRAYDEAARKLEDEIENLGELIEQDKLIDVPGIGPSLSAKITELYRTGHLSYLDQLHGEIPPGVLEMARIRDIGRERALALLRILDVTNLFELIDACEARRVRKLRGFGPKTEERLLSAARRHLGLRESDGEPHPHSSWSPDRIPGAQIELPLRSARSH